MLFCLFYLGIFDMMYPIISRESAGDGISRQNTSLFTSNIQKMCQHGRYIVSALNYRVTLYVECYLIHGRKKMKE